jgi:4-aminobutyrate aminotransferase/(S)-3-amino-2-methylpropionate transaminase
MEIVASRDMSARNTLGLLREYESPNVTFIERDGSWPIVWERAKGVHVWDDRGQKYLDLTAAFGVASAGHANPRVVRAGQRQMAKLLHAMGDVHPHPLKAKLACELSRLTFERWGGKGRTIFCNSGFEAVEAALKTAVLATGKRKVIAFEGAYHGLGYGALNATHREMFRKPFAKQLGQFGEFAPFPTKVDELAMTESRLRSALQRGDVGAILVEPVQGRAGAQVPVPELLPLLRKFCDETGALLVVDEIYAGFGRTGRWFACEHTSTIPDIICLGKAMSGGFPISACVGKGALIKRAWPESQGEAIHTSTFLGHPVGCAMALANIAEIRSRKLVENAAEHGRSLLEFLSDVRVPGLSLQARGLGLLAGLEVRHASGEPATDLVMRVVKAMLKRGFIVLPEGEHSNVIGFTPPLTITKSQLRQAVRELEAALERAA